jgi:hypothetical protein
MSAPHALAYTTIPVGWKNYVRIPRSGQATPAEEPPGGLHENSETGRGSGPLWPMIMYRLAGRFQ